MKIGIVVHGPGIVDTGYALKIIESLSKYGEIRARLGGTMGRTAVIDAQLENRIDINQKLLPSQSIRIFMKEGMDVIFLLNYGKSDITGHAFGYKVQKKCDDPPLIQIERPGETDGCVISWRPDLNNLADTVASELSLNSLDNKEIIEEIEDRSGTQKEGGKTYRKIAGVSPDENIFINGIVVGKSKSSMVTLVAEKGIITKIKGGNLKEHGVGKLGKIELDKAIIKTGLLRKAAVKPRVIASDEFNINQSQPEHRKDKLTAAYLDHAAEDIYKLKDADLVVTVGDDTTLVAADILFRFNVPIFGVTDGDLDKVVEQGFKAQGSLIIELDSGLDDIVGEIILNKCFNGKETIEIDNIENFKNEMIQIIKKEIKSCIIKE